jgi:ubiquinone biosynthesis monooxygenase Coq7
MNTRRLGIFWIASLGEIDKAIKVLTVPAGLARHAGPPQEALPEAERLESSRLMRVNHAGEVAAQALYQGQALTRASRPVKAAMQQAAAEERPIIWPGANSG